ncbi:MAG: hypothetical protein GF353_18370 [Candidatus Lokiarchaeota archaeon]|nr:hypothetical protein [Candidatus Lokiarchaeota archaeon]
MQKFNSNPCAYLVLIFFFSLFLNNDCLSQNYIDKRYQLSATFIFSGKATTNSTSISYFGFDSRLNYFISSKILGSIEYEYKHQIKANSFNYLLQFLTFNFPDKYSDVYFGIGGKYSYYNHERIYFRGHTSNILLQIQFKLNEFYSIFKSNFIIFYNSSIGIFNGSTSIDFYQTERSLLNFTLTTGVRYQITDSFASEIKYNSLVLNQLLSEKNWILCILYYF